MFSKQKLLEMTNDDSINHPVGHGHPFLSPTTLAGAEGPLTILGTRYNKLLKIKVAHNDT